MIVEGSSSYTPVEKITPDQVYKPSDHQENTSTDTEFTTECYDYTEISSSNVTLYPSSSIDLSTSSEHSHNGE